MSRKQPLPNFMIVLCGLADFHGQFMAGNFGPARGLVLGKTGDWGMTGVMMKRILATALFLLVCSSIAHAGCSGSGTTWSCTAGSTTADISGAINGASNNATITLGAGTYTLTGLSGFQESKGVTIICATPPLANGAATVNSCTLNTGNSVAFGIGGWSAIVHPNLYRISGFIFNTTGQTPIWWGTGCNPCAGGTFSQIRIDHNTFNLIPGGVAMLIDGMINTNNEFYGVMDHNTVTATGQAGIIQWIGGLHNPVDSPPPQQFGTGNNMFVEDNILNFPSVGNASALGCTDAWGQETGLVIRHNTSKDCLWTSHGVTHGGGPSNFEFYNNNITMDAGAVGAGVADCYRCFHHQGSGKFIAFNNKLTAFSGKSGEAISVAHYRDVLGSVDGGMPECNGSQGFPPDGNRTPTATYQGYPCWNQPGRDVSAPGGNGYKPMYAWNNFWSDTLGEVPLVSPDFGGPAPDYHSIHMVADREWFNAVSASAQSSSTSPFNGTTGMGFGTLANRPTTCTTSTETAFGNGAAGVGYFATDVGAQGTLYTCSATNTWTVYYTPFTYPHPLVTSGGGSGGGSGGPAPPTNIIAVVQ